MADENLKIFDKKIKKLHSHVRKMRVKRSCHGAVGIKEKGRLQSTLLPLLSLARSCRHLPSHAPIRKKTLSVLFFFPTFRNTFCFLRELGPLNGHFVRSLITENVIHNFKASFPG